MEISVLEDGEMAQTVEVKQPHRRKGVCKVDGGISIRHLDSILSALPVFPSTFMPGHGPSRRNYQDQDQMFPVSDRNISSGQNTDVNIFCKNHGTRYTIKRCQFTE